jgi:hypothetical protein
MNAGYIKGGQIMIKDEKGSVIVITAVVVMMIGLTLLVLVVDMGIQFMAHQQLKTIAESAALQGASEGELVTVAINDGENIRHDVRFTITEEAETKAAEIIREYEEKYLYGLIEITDIEYEREKTSPTQGYFDRFNVTITANVHKVFKGFWGVPYKTIRQGSTAQIGFTEAAYE